MPGLHVFSTLQRSWSGKWGPPLPGPARAQGARRLYRARLAFAWTVLTCGACGSQIESRSDASASGGVPNPGPAMEREIRVLLAGEVREAEVACDGPVMLIDPLDGRELGRAGGPAMLGIVFLEQHLRCPQISGTFDVASLDVVSEGPALLTVRLGQTWRRFRGRLRFQRGPGETGTVINVVDIEDYLAAVVASELPARFHPETFRAQAVAARTYAWFQIRSRPAGRAWDVWATERSQVYLGEERERLVPQAVAAVRATEGLVCSWESPEGPRIFCSYYSARCGGTTQAVSNVRREPDLPPLAGGVVCAYCRANPEPWGPVRLSCEEVARRLKARYPVAASLGPVASVVVVRSTPEGRAVRLEIRDAQGLKIELEAENFRLAVEPTGREIRSTWCDIRVEEGMVIFDRGLGFGHGVGLCQHGAEGLAREGWGAAAILRHYYPRSSLTRAY